MKHSFFLLPFASLLLAGCGEGGAASSSVSSSILSSASSEATLPSEYVGKAAAKPIYQILVYSFADSDGDGIGDFQGIVDHLDYLSSMNVGYLWLSPVHPSDTYHHYDVKDYYAVDEAYGGEEGLKNLIAKAKEKGIGIMLDMVFNHASVHSSWFQSSVSAYLAAANAGTLEEALSDSANPAGDFELSLDASALSGTTHYLDKDGQRIYYVGNFDVSMPEFDLSSPSVVAKQKAILEYWLGLGVAGFRFDGSKYYFLGEEAKSKAYMNVLASEVRAVKEDAPLVSEYWDGQLMTTYNGLMKDSTMPVFDFGTYYGAAKGNPTYSIRSGDSRVYASKLEETEASYLNGSSGSCLPVYFLMNHDVDRYSPGSALEAKAAAAGYLLTPGTPTIYYGEEISLKGKRSSTASTDAERRLPMQWKGQNDEYRCQTFDNVAEPADQVQIGVLDALEDPSSVASYYQKVLAFRASHEELQKGIYVCQGDAKEKLAVSKIVFQGETKGYLYRNFDMEEHSTSIVPASGALDSSLDLGGSQWVGDTLTVAPYSTVYIKL